MLHNAQQGSVDNNECGNYPHRRRLPPTVLAAVLARVAGCTVSDVDMSDGTPSTDKTSVSTCEPLQNYGIPSDKTCEPVQSDCIATLIAAELQVWNYSLPLCCCSQSDQ